MDTESIQARIEHETAELRGLYPEITHCHAVLLQWTEGTEPRFSLHLDIRRPQQQLIVNGEQRADAQTALAAGFGAARERLQGTARGALGRAGGPAPDGEPGPRIAGPR